MDETRDGEQQKKPAPLPPPPNDVIPPLNKCPTCGNEQKKRESYAWTLTKKWLEPNVVMAVCTVILVIYTMRQFTEGRRKDAQELAAMQTSNDLTQGALDDSRKNRTADLDAARKLREADDKASAGERGEAKRAADATLEQMKASNAITDKARIESDRRFKASERPWVGILGIDAFTNTAAGKELITMATVQNTGRGPALQISVCTRAGWFVGNTEPGEASYKCPTLPGEIVSTSLLLSGGKLGLTAKVMPIAEPLFAAFQRGEARLIVFGEINYVDQFAGKHYLRFCSAQPKPDSKSLIGCASGNTADY